MADEEVATAEDFLRARAAWSKAANGIVKFWKTNGPASPPAQWCSDASRLLELAGELLDACDPDGVSAPCTVCGKPEAQHGSYPTCATHPFNSDGNCGYVVGARCVGAECATKGCVRASGAKGGA